MSKTIIIRPNYRRSLILAMLISSFSVTTACNIALSDKQNKNCPKVANRLSADLLHVVKTWKIFGKLTCMWRSRFDVNDTSEAQTIAKQFIKAR